MDKLCIFCKGGAHEQRVDPSLCDCPCHTGGESRHPCEACDPHRSNHWRVRVRLAPNVTMLPSSDIARIARVLLRQGPGWRTPTPGA